MPMIDYGQLLANHSTVMSGQLGRYSIRLGVDASVGHCFPPQVTTQGSTNCFTNMIAQSRMTDSYTGHCCVHGDTEVVTSEGPIKISEIHKKMSDPEFSDPYITASRCPSSGKVISSPIVASYLTKEVVSYYVLEFSTGKVMLTGEHEVLLTSGKYARVDSLLPDDVVEVGVGNVPDLFPPKVYKITEKEPVPVFDITVRNSLNAQNFQVKAGVILKNCGPTCHGAAAANGSKTVYFNQLRMHRSTDPITCGDVASNGSRDVFGGMD